jgi:NAD+ kinase
MRAIDTVCIFSKPNIPEAQRIVSELLSWLEERGVTAQIDEQTARYANLAAGGQDRDAIAEGAQLAIVLGGDGTLLAAARAVGARETPLFAVNLGSLGFLTTITLEAMYPELERALRGEFRVGPRRMLHCEVVRRGQVVGTYEALNDVVFGKAALARMINLDAFVDSHYVCRYRADGLIISTPTGSTAYSLSAGGPIIFPTVEALCLTPICPHMLTNRPVLLPGDSVIRIDVLDDDDSLFLTADGQVGEPVKKHDQVFCRISRTKINLVRPPQMKFFDVLRAKLKWGER